MLVLMLLLLPGCGGTDREVVKTASSSEPKPQETKEVAASPSSVEVQPQAVASPEPRPCPYVFPIKPASAAQYGSSHHDYPATDIFAPAGTEVVAPTDGVVDYVSRIDLWSGRTDDPATRGGLSFAIVGDDGVRYYGSISGIYPPTSLRDPVSAPASQWDTSVTAAMPEGRPRTFTSEFRTPPHRRTGWFAGVR